MSDTDTDAGPTPGPYNFGFCSSKERRIALVLGQEDEVEMEVFAKRFPVEKGEAVENAALFCAAGTAAHELPDEYDPVTVVEALPEALDGVRRAILDLQDAVVEGPPSNKAEAAVQGAMHRLKVILAEAGADETMIPGDATVALDVVENDSANLQKARRDDASQ